MYIVFALLYAFVLGFHEIFKKQARKFSATSTILVMFTSVAFVLSLMWIPMGIAVSWEFILIFALKGLLQAICLFIIIKILREADISLVTTIKLVSVVFTFIIGITIFGERASALQFVGIVLILVGVTIIPIISKQEKGEISLGHIITLLISALITTGCEVIDKYTTTYLTNFQVQFWFLLFTFIFSWIFFAVDCIKSKKFLIKKQDLKNFWIYLVGVTLFVGDLLLFLSYTSADSKMIIITILTKISVIITVIAGIMLYKEKHIAQKLLLTLLIIAGVVLVAIF